MSKEYLKDEEFKWNEDPDLDDNADEFDDSFDDVDDRPKKKKKSVKKNTASKGTASKSASKKTANVVSKNNAGKKTVSAEKKGKKKKASAKKKRRRALIVVLAILEIMALVVVGFALFVYKGLEDKVEEMNKIPDKDGNIGPSFQVENVDVNDLDHGVLETLKGYTTYAVLGLDQRSQDDYNSGQSDVMILLSVNNDTGEINMVSVYRDTWLQIDASGTFAKINAAYNRGGAYQALQALNTNLDLKIDHFVTVNWKAVAEVIDLMGGVDIEVTESLFNAKDQHGGSLLNSYIWTTAAQLGMEDKVAYPTGPGYQTLSGVQAVGLCRIRGANLMDYGRTANQRQVAMQMFEKAKSMLKKGMLPKLWEIANTAVEYVRTDITYQEIKSLIPKMSDYYLNASEGFPFSGMRGGYTFEYWGESIVAKDLVANVTKLHQILYSNEQYVPSETVINLSKQLSEMTGIYAN
ncbi:MAG: LCP family protein [Lachnospiraceae bacterium]|nr:LCP family protein [Lachnospiraceae bacterium]